MAYVVRRPAGRWEIRESYATPKGPRSRTLASFSALTPEVAAGAQKAARGSIDPDGLLRAARRAGAPIARAPQDALAEALIRALARGPAIRPGLRRLLLERLRAREARSSRPDDSFHEWIGRTPAERGEALVELLGLGDRLPKPKRNALGFPRLARRRPVAG
jgi:hypothetical protein